MTRLMMLSWDWACRGIVVSLAFGAMDSLFVAATLGVVRNDVGLLGGYVVVCASLVFIVTLPYCILLSAVERYGLFASASVNFARMLSTVVAVTSSTAVVLAVQRYLLGLDLEFAEAVDHATAFVLFVSFVAIGLVVDRLANPLLSRLAGKLPTSSQRRICGILLLAFAGYFLWTIELVLAPVHETVLLPLCSLAYPGIAVAGSWCFVPRLSRRGRSICTTLWAAVVTAAAVLWMLDPALRFVVGARNGGVRFAHDAIVAALDVDSDGSPARLLGGDDCAASDPRRGPFEREIPNDGIDQDCRGGDGVGASTGVESPDVAGPWDGCVERVIGRRPDIVLVTLDAVRADAIGLRITPSLVPLLARSSWFERGYSVSTHTTGVMPSLFSGLFMSDLGGRNLHSRGGNTDRPQTLLRALREAGYTTVAVNSWGPGHATFEGFEQSGAVFLDPPSQAGEKGTYNSSALTEFAIDAYESSVEPFFMWVHYFDAHAPYVPIDRRSLPRPEGSDYERAVSYVGFHAARLLREMVTSARGDRTVVVLTSDHGEDLGGRGREGHGPDLFEETIRVPLALWVPGCPAHLSATPVSLADLTPTLQVLSGGTTRRYTLLDAISGAPRPVPVVSEVYMMGEMRRAVISERYKLIVDVVNGGRLLFDLMHDPLEQHDIYREAPEAARVMENLYQRWLDR